MRKVRADEIKRALAKRYDGKYVFFTEVKNGNTSFVQKGELKILDGLAVSKSWLHPCLIGFEVKVDRGDYSRDTKWRDYLPLCHSFYFACPKGLILPTELPEEAGLLYYNDDGRLREAKKPVYRDITMPVDMLYYLIICRADTERHPFFSDSREYCEAYLQDKIDGKTLSYNVLTKYNEEICELKKKLKGAEFSEEYNQDKLAELEAIKELCRQMGIGTYRGQFVDNLKAALTQDIPNGMIQSIRSLSSIVDLLERYINPEEATTDDKA